MQVIAHSSSVILLSASVLNGRFSLLCRNNANTLRMNRLESLITFAKIGNFKKCPVLLKYMHVCINLNPDFFKA